MSDAKIARAHAASMGGSLLPLPAENPTTGDPRRAHTARDGGGRARRASRQRARGARGEAAGLAGAVRIRHAGREYCAWYRVAGDLLTVYCGVASNTGLLPEMLPSPTPLAERLLRQLIQAEHPGLNPE